MNVDEIFELIRTTKGSIAKSDVLKQNESNELFKKALKMGLDNFTPFNVVKDQPNCLCSQFFWLK